jgi:hypothetical protein
MKNCKGRVAFRSDRTRLLLLRFGAWTHGLDVERRKRDPVSRAMSVGLLVFLLSLRSRNGDSRCLSMVCLLFESADRFFKFFVKALAHEHNVGDASAHVNGEKMFVQDARDDTMQ